MELKEIFPKIKSILSDWSVSSEVENIIIFSYNLNEYQFNIMITPWTKDTIHVSVGGFLGPYVYSAFETKFSDVEELEKYLKKLTNTINEDLTDKLNTELKITFNNTLRDELNGKF
jgi:hypothetical protein